MHVLHCIVGSPVENEQIESPCLPIRLAESNLLTAFHS